ncbi:MAG: chemotaxis protein CheX [Deltaproteobacteria bacterium]|nr:chemotaxis protein CheX [Deltaproteobacteria bacterium]
MKKILGINCSSKVEKVLADLIGEKGQMEYEPFHDRMVLEGYQMVVLEMGRKEEQTVQQIRKLRYACNFQNIPIVLIHGRKKYFSSQPYMIAGATEVLSIHDPSAACRQIINGHLIPSREPLAEEFEYLEPFIKNTCHILQTMASIDVKFKEVYFSNAIRIFGDVSGIMGLSGNADGTLVVTFFWDLAKMVVAKMMGMEEENVDAELIHDGVSEFINMISGSTKREFVGKPYHFEISLPSVVVGPGHQIGHLQDTSVAVLIFQVGVHCFALHVCIKPKEHRVNT